MYACFDVHWLKPNLTELSWFSLRNRDRWGVASCEAYALSYLDS